MTARPLFLLILLAFTTGAPPLRADWTDDYAVLLKKYVTPDGVHYATWKKNAADLASLDRVTSGIAAPAKNGDLAFYLNAYNAWILREALAKYPTKSVRDALFTFFISDRITVGGVKMSFNKLEKDVIRAKFKEPRVHFALNCASRSCPPLNPEPFRARDLDAQLEKLATAFVNSDRGVRVKGGSVELSKIFDWYKDDFGGTPGAISFINKHRAQPIPADAKISFQTYNWNLNEVK